MGEEFGRLLGGIVFWGIVLAIVAFILMGQISFLADDLYHGPAEFDDPEVIITDAAHRNFTGAAYTALPRDEYEPLLSGYEVEGDPHHRWLTLEMTDRAAGHRFWRPPIQDESRSQDENPDTDQDEKQILSENENLTRALDHIKAARDISQSRLSEKTSPESLATDALIGGTAAEPVYLIYSGAKDIQTIYRVNQELQAATDAAGAALTEARASSTSEAGTSSDPEAAYYAPSVRSWRAGKIIDMMAQPMTYYRYVQTYGEDPDYYHPGQTEVEWANKSAQTIAAGPDVSHHRLTGPVGGEVEWVAVSWGNDRMYAVTSTTGFSLDPRYRDTAFTGHFPEAQLKNDGTATLNEYFDRFYTLCEGGRDEWPSKCDDPSADGLAFPLEEDYDLPPEATLVEANYTAEERERLRAFAEIGDRYEGIARTQERRWERQRERMIWEPFDSTRDRSLIHVMGFNETFRTEQRRLEYLYTITAAAQTYNESKYVKGRGYVETEAKVEAQRRLLDRFESAEAFEAHLSAQIDATESAREPVASYSNAEILSDRLAIFFSEAASVRGIRWPADAELETPLDLLKYPNPFTAVMFVLSDLFVLWIPVSMVLNRLSSEDQPELNQL